MSTRCAMKLTPRALPVDADHRAYAHSMNSLRRRVTAADSAAGPAVFRLGRAGAAGHCRPRSDIESGLLCAGDRTGAAGETDARHTLRESAMVRRVLSSTRAHAAHAEPHASTCAPFQCGAGGQLQAARGDVGDHLQRHRVLQLRARGSGAVRAVQPHRLQACHRLGDSTGRRSTTSRSAVSTRCRRRRWRVTWYTRPVQGARCRRVKPHARRARIGVEHQPHRAHLAERQTVGETLALVGESGCGHVPLQACASCAAEPDGRPRSSRARRQTPSCCSPRRRREDAGRRTSARKLHAGEGGRFKTRSPTG